MSARIPASTPDKISDNYVAVASAAMQGLKTDIIDHDAIAREGVHKRLVFYRDDGSGLLPLGAKNLAPMIESVPPPVVFSFEVSPPEPEVVSPPIVGAATNAPAPAPLPPVKPRPQVVVEFVSDIIDLSVLCHEVNWSAETNLLSLLIPEATRLKLGADQHVTIRSAAAGERVYWFTGIAIPVKVMESVLLVFGLEKK
jgi:hypothetical protein